MRYRGTRSHGCDAGARRVPRPVVGGWHPHSATEGAGEVGGPRESPPSGDGVDSEVAQARIAVESELQHSAMAEHADELNSLREQQDRESRRLPGLLRRYDSPAS
ncbi:hypothetical protein GCM10009837_19820 [Streptomyces durmitorensis]